MGLRLNDLPKYIFCESDHRIERSFCSPLEKISLISEPLLSNITSALCGPAVVVYLLKAILFAFVRLSIRPRLLLKPDLSRISRPEKI